jgi:repressor LexA
MAAVSKAVRRVYDALCALIGAGDNPSARELATATGLAASTVNTHLKALRTAGWVAWTEGTTRSLRIVGGPGIADPALVAMAEPSLHSRAGYGAIDLSEHAVAAGPPIPTAAINDALYQSRRQPLEGTIFTIRAQGDSMIGKAIIDGDTLVVRAQSYARHGDLVVAILPDGTDLHGATVKIYDENSGDRPRLLAANPAYGPIESDELRVVGKVIEVWRKIAA